MIARNFLTPGICGTTGMTLFSYYLSLAKKRNFREPVLLGHLIRSLLPVRLKYSSTLPGWILHYLVGIFFAFCYQQALQRRMLLSSIVYPVTGALTGLIGVGGWDIVLRLHPSPPKINRRRFYGQLVIAHIIYACITLALLNSRNRRKVK